MEKIKEQIFELLMNAPNVKKCPDYYKKCGMISLAEAKVFEFIGMKKETTVSAIAEAFQISRAGASQFVDRLTQKKLLKRVPQKDDRRVVKLILSSLGEKFYHDHQGCQVELMKIFEEELRFFDDDTSEKILIALNRAFKRIIDKSSESHSKK